MSDDGFDEYGSDDGYDEYDNPYGFGDPASLGFQEHGYGGFGYSTSHVKADDPQPDVVEYSARGDLQNIKDLVKDTTSAKERRLVLNASRRWTEVDFKASGFTKEYEWHDLTPVASAARRGQVEVLRYLLESGEADPTLAGCPAEDMHLDAFQAAPKRHPPSTSTGSNSAKRQKVEGPTKCSDTCAELLEAVKPFWDPASYKSSRYSTYRVKEAFPNSCKDVDAMRKAIAAVK
jgi:hypothetical protein